MRYCFISVLIAAMDGIVKKHIESHIKEGSEKSICNGKLLIRKHHNKGVVLNAFDRHQKLMAAVSVGMTAFLIQTGADIFRRSDQNAAGKVGLSFLIGGAVSNTLDRVCRGYVVDYLSFSVKWNKFKNIVFNISDFFIIFGAIVAALFYKGEGAEE